MSNENTISEVNAKRLLWAGFMAILAAGVGFAIRGGIFDNWGAEYGFTATQLGAIGGMGFSGFCFGIIIGGVVVDKIGYGKLVFAAFLFHFLSAVVTFTAAGDTAYVSLAWGMFIFAFANGTLEAVANPLVATLFPQNRNHYLNILHASWPAGLVLGGIVGWVLDDKFEWKWQYQLALYLVPTLIYGVMFFGQKYPKSEAAEKGLSLGEMFKEVGILGGLVVCYLLVLFFQGILPSDYSIVSWLIGGALLVTIAIITGFSIGHWLIFVLFITHALVGAVELGTDGWIQNIIGNMLSSEEGKILFVWTSMCMFGLRFCAHWMEKNLKIKPVTLLFICAVMACIGLNLVSGATAFTGAIIALTIYGFGKTFFWPTMLAVASDRFPRSGAIAISIMGGIGMMSSGLLGSPGLGYAKDRFSGEALNEANPQLYAEYKAETPSKWLFLKEVNAIDAKKYDAITKKKAEERTENEKTVAAASIEGDRRTLKADSFIPAVMAVIYLLLMIYFKSIGGYKPVAIEEQKE
ncbi:MAG: MFS transporter [Verrucomicrobiota bacterium]|nr:MFS transporter [Verrucomicrobiota bacterium]